MVGVGGLAALINVLVLITVAVADRVIGLTVRNFAAAGLKNRKRAPIVHDSDTWLPNIPRSVVKYYRHPAILATLLCTVLLIASELVTEIGVDVSDTCRPVPMSGSVITAGDISGHVTIVEKGASAFMLQNLSFLDGPLKRAPAGLPRHIRGNECLECMDKDPELYPDVTSHCSVTKSQTYAAGDLEIGVDGSGISPFGNVTFGFKERFGAKEEFRVSDDLLHGDITTNGAHYAAFIFLSNSSKSTKSTDELTYFEYSAQEHIPKLIDGVTTPEIQQKWEITEAKVDTWKIKCEVNELSMINFQTAISVYRTIQLENPVDPATYDDAEMRFAEMRAEDIYRAALSIKVMDDNYADREYLVYTTCGVYRWKLVMPMTLSLVLVLGLAVLSLIRSPEKSLVRSVPYNSRTWYSHARMVESYEEPLDLEKQSIEQQHMGSMSHEMFLLEFGGAPGAVPRVSVGPKEVRYPDGEGYPDAKRRPSDSTCSR